MKRIAYFVSPHGFGHAARAAAVMQAVSNGSARFIFDIFTTVPPWFFQDSMTAPFVYHEVLTDIGLSQKSAFKADLNQTLRYLNSFLPFRKSAINEVTASIKKLNNCLIVSDIAPMGIQVAEAAGIPSVLVENFTWDWIYYQYLADDPRFGSHISYLRDLFQSAHYHIQTEPVCSPGNTDLTTSPVSRTVKTPADQIRRQLNIADSTKMVLVTTGGIMQTYGFLNELSQFPDICFVLPGSASELKYQHNVVFLPQRSDFYHPDLVNAADAVVGKAGYSTLSEIYQAGVPFGYVLRSNFRESGPLAAFIAREMQGIALSEADFSSGKWISQLKNLLSLKHLKRASATGSVQIANFICKHILGDHA